MKSYTEIKEEYDDLKSLCNNKVSELQNLKIGYLDRLKNVKTRIEDLEEKLLKNSLISKDIDDLTSEIASTAISPRDTTTHDCQKKSPKMDWLCRTQRPVALLEKTKRDLEQSLYDQSTVYEMQKEIEDLVTKTPNLERNAKIADIVYFYLVNACVDIQTISEKHQEIGTSMNEDTEIGIGRHYHNQSEQQHEY